MFRQGGAVILLLASVLMTVALLLSVSHSQLVYLQVKQGRNEVSERQNYWLAEAGLECAFLQISQASPLSLPLTLPLLPPLHNCDLIPYAEVTVTAVTEEIYRINSHYKTVTVNRYFYFPTDVESSLPKWLEGSWHE